MILDSIIRCSFVGVIVTAIIAATSVPRSAYAQEESSDFSAQDRQATRQADDAVRAAESQTERAKEKSSATRAAADAKKEPALNWLQLLTYEGGVLMIPIWGISVIALAFAVERAIAIRRSRVIPGALIESFGQASGGQAGFDPRRAFRVCQQYPSAAASVIRAMLLKVGRPHAEVEHAVAEASNREAARLYSNVRWLNMAAAVAPLLGLLGTVQGMIMSFFTTANLLPGQNKAQVLAQGIYIALATTFAGLTVAIPATVIAHWFEGRIQSLFREIDELLFSLLPQVERYEGRLRVNRAAGEIESESAVLAGEKGK
jgi:biopolymer transport protein ExbB